MDIINEYIYKNSNYVLGIYFIMLYSFYVIIYLRKILMRKTFYSSFLLNIFKLMLFIWGYLNFFCLMWLSGVFFIFNYLHG